MRQGSRGWPKDSPIKSLAQWLDENGYRDKQITDAYLHEIVGVYSERNQGENPTKTSGGDIYVRDGRGGYFANGDTFEKVNASMRRGYRGWKDSPIKGLSQWLDKNGYRDNQITEAYLHEIVGVYREMHPGKNPTQNSDAIYVRDGNGGYVTNGDKFINVDMSIRNKGRGWPKDSPIKSLSQWLKNNGYKPSKESETDLVANQVALQILLTR
jgi:peptidoglycan hydrolase-like protein with peptidoglycan-binding domain